MNSLQEQALDIEKTSEPVGVNVKCARFEANISGTSGEDFPPIPTVENGLAVKIDAGVLREAISRVSFAAGKEASRPVLTGVKTEIRGDEFKVADDDFSLAVYSAKLAETPAEDIDFLMPASVMNEIGRLLGSEEAAVELTVTPSGNQALCRVGDVEIVTSLIAGNFADYDLLIPQSYNTRVVLSSGDFLRATRTAAVFARDDSHVIRLQMAGGEGDAPGCLTVSARAVEVGNNQGRLDVAVEGDDARIAINYKYLIDVLDAIGADVAIEITSATSPGVLRPAESDDYVHIVMPMFVQNGGP